MRSKRGQPRKEKSYLKSQTYKPVAAELSNGTKIAPGDFVLDQSCKGCHSLWEACLCMYHHCNHTGGVFTIDGYYGDQIVAGFIVRFDEGNITRVSRFDVLQKGGDPQ